MAAASKKSTRAVRESQRKINHSIIEKRRREKINAALAELRSLVPENGGGLDGEEGDCEGGTGGGKSGKGEFKLEVLVR